MEITAAGLVAACGNESEDAGIRVRTRLEPLAGPLTPVKPPTYLGARYQEEHRWWDGTESTEPVRVVMIDSIASQANRLEAALEQEAGPLGLPQVVLDLSGIGSLPSHVPSRLSGFRFPHRQADAYLRDAVLDGQGFPSTEMGRDILGATAERPEALLRWFPQALLFGFWQSHLGKKRSQAKLARSWFSEIVGYVPAETGTRQLGTKGDPLNLSTDEAVQYEDTDLLTGWELVEGTKRAPGSKKRDSLAEIGHGQVPFRDTESAPLAVSFRAVQQLSTVSFAGLRRIRTGDPAADARARALLVTLGLVAHTRAFGRAMSLRSGCDLRPRTTEWTWLGAESDEALAPVSGEEAVTLFRECVQAAEAAGLPVGSQWAGAEVVLTPSDSLGKAIRATYPLDA